MFDFNELLRGYTDVQYSEALFHLLINFLRYKGILEVKEFQEFADENFTDILKQVVERDRDKAKEVVDKYKKEEN